MRLRHALLLIPLLSTPSWSEPVFAQTTTPQAGEHHGRRSAAEHFAEANTTHDGKLTLEQAMTGYKSIAKTFMQIDVNRRGYVTMDDIKTWKAAKKAAKLAAKHAAEDTAAGIIRPTPAMQRGANPRLIDTSTGTVAPGSSDAPRTGIDLPVAPIDGGRSS